jgi:hypothetical protein
MMKMTTMEILSVSAFILMTCVHGLYIQTATGTSVTIVPTNPCQTIVKTWNSPFTIQILNVFSFNDSVVSVDLLADDVIQLSSSDLLNKFLENETFAFFNSSVMVVDASSFYGGFFEDIANNVDQKLSAFNPSLVFILVSGDDTRAGFLAKFNWKRKLCTIPTFIVSASWKQTLLSTSQVNLPFPQHEPLNQESAFMISERVIVGGIIPCIIVWLTIILYSVSLLYRMGAPRVFNTAVVVCCFALVQLPFYGKSHFSTFTLLMSFCSNVCDFISHRS